MNQQLKFTNKILYYALMLSRLIFAYILYVIIAPGSQPSEDQTLVYVIMGIAFTIGAISHYLHNKSYNSEFLLSPDSWIMKVIMQNKVSAEVKKGTEEEIKNSEILNKFTSLSIFSWALSESIAIFGAISPYLGGTLEIGMCFIAVSIAIGFQHRPNFERLSYNLII